VECECGRQTLVDQATPATCPECGADHTSAREGLEGRPLVEDAIYYPEHLAYEEWQREQKAHPHYDEHDAWLELEALE
jgi:hypothetical protein